MMVKRDIFEDIVHEIPKCQYISDLRSMVDRNDVFAIITVLEKTDADVYSVQQWHELYRYLFTESDSFETSEDVKNRIIYLLKE